MIKRSVKKKAWWLGTMGLVLMLAMAAGHCFADGEEGGGGGGDDTDECPVNLDPSGNNCPSSITTSVSVQSGARYRKIGLNGMPLPDEKPQHKDESDQHPEETYIDALDLTLNHSVTDIYIPLGGSADLALNVRRNVQSEVWNVKGGLKPQNGQQIIQANNAEDIMVGAGRGFDRNIDPTKGDDVNPNKPFGLCWSSNLAATIEFSYPWRETEDNPKCTPPRMEPDTATVTDENGKQHRFVIMHGEGFGTGLFFPLPSSDSQQDTMADTLVTSGTDESGNHLYTFTRKYGTKLVFQFVDGLQKNAISQPIQPDPHQNSGTIYNWARVTKVVDRYGTAINYSYGSLLSLIPATISSGTGAATKTITITTDPVMNVVTKIVDPMNHQWKFNYALQSVVAGDLGQSTHMTHFVCYLLTSVIGPDDTTTKYGYWHTVKEDHARKIGPDDFHNAYVDFAVNSITDPNNRTYQILYYVPSGQRFLYEYSSLEKGYKPDYGVPPCVFQVKMPVLSGSTVTANFENLSFLCLWNYDPNDGKRIAVLGNIGCKITDAAGKYHEYDFGHPVATPQDQFEDLLEHSDDPRNVPLLLTCNSMILHQPDYTHYETFVYDGDMGGPITLPGDGGIFQHSPFGGHTGELASTTDLCGNTTTFEYGDTWDAHGSVPYLGPYPLIHFPNPTKQTDALGHSKYFTYDPTWRIMKSSTDENGHTTVNDIDPDNGNRLSEKIYDAPGTITTISGTSSRRLIFHSGSLTPAGNLVQETDYEYANTSFPGFLTKKTVKKLSLAGDPGGSWFTDLVTQYVPDAAGNVYQEIVDPGSGHLNLTTTGSYDANNNKISSTDPRGNTIYFSYDYRNRLTTTTFPDGTSKSFVYDARGNKIKEYDENGVATLYAYDEWNRVVKQARDMNGNSVINSGTDLVTSYTYNNVNSKTSVTDPNGNVTTMVYDDYQRLTSTINPDWSGNPLGAAARTTTFEYDPAKNCGGNLFDTSGFKPTKTTDPLGYVTEITYDQLYRKTSTVQTYQLAAGASLALSGTTTATYDNVGNAISTIDPLGNKTQTDYDALNQPTVTRFAVLTGSAVNPDYGYTENYYASTGLKWQTRDEEGVLSEMNYDAAGRAVKVIADSATLGLHVHATTQSVYDAAGNVVSTINPLGNQWDYTFDVRNRKTMEQDPAVLDAVSSGTLRPTKTWKYDNVGNAITTIDPRGYVYQSAHPTDTTYQTDTVYDAANRVTQVTQPPDVAGNRPVSSTLYDLNGNATQVTDPNGHITQNVYDALNRLVTTTQDPSGLDIAVNYTYDQVGNRLTVSDGLGQTTLFEYDGLKRNTKVTDAGGNATSFVYDAVNKTQRIDALTQVTKYKEYDLRNRLLTVEYPSRTDDNRVYSYDKTGNLLGVAIAGYSHAADVGYTYDALRRQVTETSGGLTHAYVYDPAGNRLSATYGGTGHTIISTYDALNRLKTMTEGGSRLTCYRYDLNGNIVKKILPNADTESVTFDYLNRDVSQIATSGTNSLYQFAYAYDLAGNDTSVTETYSGGLNNRTVANTYDNINRLGTEAITTGTTTVSTAYTYDKANNRGAKVITGGTNAGTTSYSYNVMNQLTSYSDGSTTVTGTYDANGNRQYWVKGGAMDTYSYDVENRLVGLVKNISGAGITTGTYAYLYDYRTRRVKRDESNASGVATQVVFSGGTSEQEYTLSGTTPVLTVEYVRGSDYGGGVGGVLYTLRGALLSYTHENRRGDVVAKTDATGSLTYQAAYEAFGKRTQEQGSTLDRQKANTKDEDPTGLLNEGQRYRDLETGVFLTKDPAGFVDGPNLYTYVNQNPWTKFDPEGLYLVDAGTLARAVAVTAGVAFETTAVCAGQLGFTVAGAMPPLAYNHIRREVNIIKYGNPWGKSDVQRELHKPAKFGHEPSQRGWVFTEHDDPEKVAEFHRLNRSDPIAATLKFVEILNKRKDTQVETRAKDNPGVIYLRIDKNNPNGKPYIGQAESEKRFLERQGEHADDNPSARYIFKILERGKPGQDLSKKEEDWIRRFGGPSRVSTPDGGTANKRSQMNEKKYKNNSGKESDPTRQ